MRREVEPYLRLNKVVNLLGSTLPGEDGPKRECSMVWQYKAVCFQLRSILDGFSASHRSLSPLSPVRSSSS